MKDKKGMKGRKNKYYCESCAKEITEEEKNKHKGLCKKCFL